MKRIQFILIALVILIMSSLLLVFAADEKGTESESLLKGNALKTVSGSAGKVSFNYNTDDAMLSDMTKVSENETYELYYHRGSMAVAIKNKQTGNIFLSNPFDAENDKYFSGEIKKNLESQIVLNYVSEDNQVLSLWSSSDCAELGQFTIYEYQNGIKIDMSIGKKQDDLITPMALTTERYEELLAKMDSNVQRKFKALYTYTEIKNISDATEKDRLLKSCPTLKNTPLYICTTLSQKEKINLDGYLREIGYASNQYHSDMKKLGIKVEKESFVNFKMSLEYTLTNDGLKATIPQKSITFDSDQFSLLSIRLLEYFGTDKPSKNGNGYLFIPDGSGSIININNQTANRRVIITGSVYGNDAALDQKNIKNEGLQYYLPVYGVVRNNGTALFSIIESGDEMSEISAKLGAPNSDYYAAYNTFLYTTEELVKKDTKVSSMLSYKNIYLYDHNITTSDYSISYHCLYGDSASYTGMAGIYKNYLKSKGMTGRKNSSLTTLGIETIGTALYENTFLGFSYKTDTKFTTYEQNKSILSYFLKKGISDISLTLTGWQKSGLDCSVSNTVKLSGALGGESKFDTLTDFCSQNHIPIYSKADMLFTKYDRAFDGFSKGNDASKRLDRDYAGIAKLQPDTQQYGDVSYAISPHKYTSFFMSFFKKYLTLGVKGVNLSTIGTYLNSNFNSSNSYNRTQSKEILTGLLKKQSSDYSLSFDGANAYILPYASVLNEIPVTDSEYLGESASVPFLQLAVSGCISYRSSAVNMSDDIQTELLNCIQSGTSPSFTLAYDNIEKLKLTSYSYYYSISFDVLKDEVAESYNYVKTALSKTDGTALVRHDIIADGVVCSTFENGAKVYVNYSDTDYTDGQLSISSKSYLAV